MIMILAIAAAAVGGGWYWANSKKSEKFTVYRPNPPKKTWARDAVLTRVINGKIA